MKNPKTLRSSEISKDNFTDPWNLFGIFESPQILEIFTVLQEFYRTVESLKNQKAFGFSKYFGSSKTLESTKESQESQPPLESFQLLISYLKIFPRITVEDFEDVKNAILVIKDVTKQDRGHYTCEGKHLDSIDSDRVATTITFVRVKDKLAALWPFLGICTNMFLLCLIIFISERRRKNKAADDEDSDTEQSDNRYEIGGSKNRYRK